MSKSKIRSIKTVLSFNMAFDRYQMGRIDELIDKEVAANSLEKGVVKITVPDGVFLTTIEYEKDLVRDFMGVYSEFEMHTRNNVSPYILSKLPGNELYIPFNLGNLVIGDWQQVVFFTLAKFKHLEIELEFIESDSILGLESLHTTDELQTFDITDIIQRTLMNSSGENITMIVPSPSAALYTLIPEKFDEFIGFLKTFAPSDCDYLHKNPEDEKADAYVHLRSAVVGQALTLKTNKGELFFNEGERLFLTELDFHPNRRDIYFEVWK